MGAEVEEGVKPLVREVFYMASLAWEMLGWFRDIDFQKKRLGKVLSRAGEVGWPTVKWTKGQNDRIGGTGMHSHGQKKEK